MRLGTHAAERSAGNTDNEAGLVLERRVVSGARCPVDGVLENTGDAVIVFGSDKDDTVSRCHLCNEGLHSRIVADIRIVMRKQPGIRNTVCDIGFHTLDQRPYRGTRGRRLTQAARDEKNLCHEVT